MDEDKITQPNPETIIWRYLTFSKFVALLKNKALFFCRADKLGDPFEGAKTTSALEKLYKNFASDRVKDWFIDVVSDVMGKYDLQKRLIKSEIDQEPSF